MERRVRVADFAVARAPDVLCTVGLGSCVAVALVNVDERVAALGHALLPCESMSRDTGNRAKFATTIIPLLIDALRDAGARGPVVAKIAGGSRMFASIITGAAANIGDRNVDAVRTALHAARIPIAGEDVGGEHGRSIYVSPSDGRMVVRALRRGEVVL